jgi:large subunit ribosomal protein L6
MSRIGKRPIILSKGVSVSLNGNSLTVSGPRGTLSRALPPDIDISIGDDALTVAPRNNEPRVRALWGLTRQMVANMVKGVSEGFTVGLEIQGGGYKATLDGKTLVLTLGFSHDIRLPLPDSITAEVKENILTLKSPDNELLGKFAAQIRGLRPPDPYRGKGIRYAGEIIRKKEVKAATAKGAGG